MAKPLSPPFFRLLMPWYIACALFCGEAEAGSAEAFHFEGGHTPDGGGCSVSFEIRSTSTQGFGDVTPVRNEEICGFEINADSLPNDAMQNIYGKLMQRCEYIGRVPLTLGSFTTAWFGESSPYVSLHVDRGFLSNAVTVEEDPARFSAGKGGPTIECRGLRRTNGRGEVLASLENLLRKLWDPKAAQNPAAPALLETRAPAKIEPKVGEADSGFSAPRIETLPRPPEEAEKAL